MPGVTQIPAPYPRHGTRDTQPRSHQTYPYGAFTLYGAPFQGTSGSPGRHWVGSRNSTSPTPFGVGFGLPCSVFGRPYSRNPYWFLFLRVLRCFNSPGSPSHEGVSSAEDRKSHSEIHGSQAPYASPWRIAAGHVLHRHPSRAIPRTAYSATFQSIMPERVCLASSIVKI